MTREDAALAIERHATSKIRTAADLGGDSTRSGFRGEALPSIASVSRFRLRERGRAAPLTGTELRVEAGRLLSCQREVGAPEGTLVEVADLFFNLPGPAEIPEGRYGRVGTGVAARHPAGARAIRRSASC